MHTSDALSQLHNFTDTPDDKDVTPLNFLQHITPNYIEHSYSHFVENLYIHKTKALDATPVKQKCDRPPKPKPEIPISKTRTLAAAGTSTTRPRQHPRSLNNEIVSQQMIAEINTEREKSERLTVAKLNALKQYNKQDHKSKLMTEKCSLLPLNSQQLTPVQTAIQRMSEKHPDFDSECPYNITLGRTSILQLSAWQDYESHKLYIQQISVPLTVRNNVRVLLGETEVVSLTLQPNKTSFTPRHTITGKGVAYVKPFDSKLPLRPIEIKFENNRCCIEVHNTSNTTVEFLHGQEMTYFDARSKGIVQTNNSKHFPIDQYLHDRMTPATLSPTPLAYEKPIHPTEMPRITTCTELSVDDTNKPTSDDKYPWLESDDIRRNMTDSEILRMKLSLKDSVLDKKGKEEFLKNVEQFTDIFSLRDEIGTCPFIEVHLKLKDEIPFFVRLYPMREEQKKVIQKEMDRLEHLGIIRKGLTGYSSPVVLEKWKNQNLYQVCNDFCIINEKLVQINHAFPLVRDCIEQLGKKKCHYLSTIDLRDAFHTLQLALSSQKYCRITPYYGSPTYHYLRMGMGMSMSPQIWQQFVDLVFQDDLIKHKQNFHVIMNDTFIHPTAEEHMDDLMDLFKVLRKYGLKLSPHKCQFFKKKIVYMGIKIQIQGDKSMLHSIERQV